MNKREAFKQRLAEIPPEKRTELEAMFEKHFQPRKDGGLDHTLNDQLWQVYRGSSEALASSHGLEYVNALRSALHLRK